MVKTPLIDDQRDERNDNSVSAATGRSVVTGEVFPAENVENGAAPTCGDGRGERSRLDGVRQAEGAEEEARTDDGLAPTAQRPAAAAALRAKSVQHDERILVASRLARACHRQSCPAFWLMDDAIIARQLDLFHASFNYPVAPLYALRANSHPALIRVLAGKSGRTLAGFTVSDRVQMEECCAILEENQTSQTVHWAQPFWTRKAAKQLGAMENPGVLGVVESEEEMMQMLAYAPDSGLLLRVSTMQGDEDDVEWRLGCSMEEAETLISLAAKTGARLIGLALHAGPTSKRSHLVRMARRLFEHATREGLQLSRLDVGGGFSPNADEFRLEAAELDRALTASFPRKDWPDLDVVASVGRFLAAPAFTLFTDLTNGGLIHCSEAIRLAKMADRGDMLVAGILPVHVQDDWVSWPRMGAYTSPGYDGETPVFCCERPDDDEIADDSGDEAPSSNVSSDESEPEEEEEDEFLANYWDY